MSFKKYLKRGIDYVMHGVPTTYVTANVTYTSPHDTLHDKKIIVTGGGSGIGYAMAKKFKEEYNLSPKSYRETKPEIARSSAKGGYEPKRL